MSLDTFAVSVDRHGDELVLTCAGELDMFGADILGSVVQREVAETRPGGCVWIDCSGVTFMDSIGVKALLHAGQLAFERDVDFTVEPSAPMRKLLETIGVASALSLTP